MDTSKCLYAIQVSATTPREVLAEKVGVMRIRYHKGRLRFLLLTRSRKYCAIALYWVFLSHVLLNFTCLGGRGQGREAPFSYHHLPSKEVGSLDQHINTVWELVIKAKSPAPDKLAQKLWGWSPVISDLTSPPGNCEARQHLKITDAEKAGFRQLQGKVEEGSRRGDPGSFNPMATPASQHCGVGSCGSFFPCTQKPPHQVRSTGLWCDPGTKGRYDRQPCGGEAMGQKAGWEFPGC